MEPWEIDLRVALDESMADPSTLTPLPQLSWWWFHCMGYQWDGYDHKIVSVQEARRRRYGACGDAAAHLLAAAKRQGIRALLCIEEPKTLRGYRHVRVNLPTLEKDLDPFASLRPKLDDKGEPLAATCERMMEL